MTTHRKQMLLKHGPTIARMIEHPEFAETFQFIAQLEISAKREQSLCSLLHGDSHAATVKAAGAAGIQDFLDTLHSIVADYRKLATPGA